METEKDKLIADLMARVQKLEDTLNSNMDNTTMSPEFGIAMAERLGIAGIEFGSPDDITVQTTIDEAGAASHNVPALMDGMIPIRVKGKLYYVPYYII